MFIDASAICCLNGKTLVKRENKKIPFLWKGTEHERSEMCQGIVRTSGYEIGDETDRHRRAATASIISNNLATQSQDAYSYILIWYFILLVRAIPPAPFQ